MKLYIPAKRAATALAFPIPRPAVRRATSAYPFAPGALWREQEALMSKAFARQSSPRYELTNTAEKFEIAIDVPGVKPEDINVSLENDGKILTLSGTRETRKEGYQYSNRFSQSFSLDRTVDAEKLTANLSNGVLVISAPKDPKRLEELIKKIPITQHAHAEQQRLENGENKETALEKQEIVVETVDEKNEEMEEVDGPKIA